MNNPDQTDKPQGEANLGSRDLLGTIARELRAEGDSLYNQVEFVIPSARDSYRLRSSLMLDLAKVLDRVAANT